MAELLLCILFPLLGHHSDQLPWVIGTSYICVLGGQSKILGSWLLKDVVLGNPDGKR
jgi:hypothetical protein